MEKLDTLRRGDRVMAEVIRWAHCLHDFCPAKVPTSDGLMDLRRAAGDFDWYDCGAHVIQLPPVVPKTKTEALRMIAEYQCEHVYHRLGNPCPSASPREFAEMALGLPD